MHNLHLFRSSLLRNILVHHDTWVKIKRESDVETKGYLCKHLEFPREPFLSLLHLYPVVKETYNSQPNGSDQHELHIHIPQAPKE